MRAHLLTDEALPGADEDAAGVLGEVAVVLDGAGVPQRFRAGCHHSVAWYSHTLAAHLLLRAYDPARTLREALADAITAVRDLHADQCDLDAGSPSATVVAVRRREDRLEHLVLCDSSLLLHHCDGTVRRITDDRVDHLVLADHSAPSVEAMRNAPGGFWLARHEPEAADEALTGSVPLADLRAVHLVSDGITRAIDRLGLHTPASLSETLLTAPEELLEQLRTTERALDPARRPRKIHDDATALTLRW